MRQNYYLKFENSKNQIDKFKKFVEKHDCSNITVDFSSLNIFEALKYLVLLSAYHFQKYPSGKLKCSGLTPEIILFTDDLLMKNLEFV